MADTAEESAAQTEPRAKRSIVRMLGIGLGIVLIFAIAGLLVFRFVVQPRLNTDPNVQPRVILNTIPVPFEETFTTVIMPSENMLASTLLYKVSMECSDQATADLIAKYRPRFVAMIRKLHSYKTRAELDDPLVEESIRKQILQEANALIAEIQGGENPKNRIVAVYHEKFYIQDA
jgi:flagellar basal body-associated protein FliL